MNGWDELSLGKYDIKERYIHLDYRELFLDPVRADITLAHEASHSVMAEFDIGQGYRTIAHILPHYSHLSDAEKVAIQMALRNAQIFVQEGFATFMEIARLSAIMGKSRALKWAAEHLHPEYKARFDKLSFAFDLSHKYREAFTSKLSRLALETGFRKHVCEQNLLRDAQALVKYLEQDDHNPNIRLEKMLSLLRDKPWLVMKDETTIALSAGIAHFPQVTREEVANYLTYLMSFTSSPRTFDPIEIGDTPEGSKLFENAFSNVMVRNANLDLASTAIALPNVEDFLHYADVIEAIFITEAGKNEVYKNISPRTNPDHEIAFLGFCKTGEKYMALMSRQKATKVLNTELSEATLLTKQGGVDISMNRAMLNETARLPNVVVYNNPRLLKDEVVRALENDPSLKFSYRHIGASEDHPFQTIVLVVDGQIPIHVANGYGNRDISELILSMSGRTRILGDEEFLSHGKHINNFLSFWMGLPWEIDWVKSMIRQDDLYRR